MLSPHAQHKYKPNFEWKYRRNPTHPLAYGLIGHWILNEGTGLIAHDLSINRNHCTLTNFGTNSGWRTSAFKTSILFDNTDDYLIRSNPTGIPTGVCPFTVCAWVATTSSAYYETVFNINTYAPGFYVYSGRLLIFHVTNIGPGNIYVNDGKWHFIAWTRSGTTTFFYVDGRFDASFTYSTSWTTATQLMIGWDTYSGDQYDGHIGDVRLYNRALSSNELQWLYEEPYADFEYERNRRFYIKPSPPQMYGTSVIWIQ